LVDRLTPLLKKRNAMRQTYQSKAEVPPKQPPKQPPKPENELMSELDFDQFWQEFPLKEDKKKAKDKFLKLKKNLLPKILSSIQEHKEKSEKWKK
jgi:hypothetical protein